MCSPFGGVFLGGVDSISAKLEVWTEMLKEDFDRVFLLSGIEFGFRISDLSVEDCASVKMVSCRNHSSAIFYGDKVEIELIRQIQSGCYVMASEPPLIVSPLGAIPKEGSDDVRIIHDGSIPQGEAMNDYCDKTSVCYETLDQASKLAKPNWFMAKVDLKSAYRSVPIHPADYCLSGLQWDFQGEKESCYLFDTRLPFGSRLAPGIFHRITQSVKRHMVRLGFVHIVVYLDDFLVLAETYAECLKAQHALISLLGSLGFCVSWHKVLGPSQKLPFLGIVINTCQCTLSLDSKKVCVLEDRLRAFSGKVRSSKRQLQALAGLLNWACSAVRGGRFFLRRVINAINCLKLANHKCRLSFQFKKDILWWLSYLRSFNGVVYYRECAKLVVHTDASQVGAGMFHAGDWHYTNWSVDYPSMVDSHINNKEVMAVMIAADKWAPSWKNCDVTVLTDSIVAKSVINKGTCRNTQVMSALRHFFWLSVKYNFRLKAIHMPGKLNQLPDAISRLDCAGEVLRLHSLLANWYHVQQSCLNIEWTKHMSSGSFQMIQPSLRLWDYRLNYPMK